MVPAAVDGITLSISDNNSIASATSNSRLMMLRSFRLLGESSCHEETVIALPIFKLGAQSTFISSYSMEGLPVYSIKEIDIKPGLAKKNGRAGALANTRMEVVGAHSRVFRWRPVCSIYALYPLAATLQGEILCFISLVFDNSRYAVKRDTLLPSAAVVTSYDTTRKHHFHCTVPQYGGSIATSIVLLRFFIFYLHIYRKYKLR